jgi:hypothetical protein
MNRYGLFTHTTLGPIECRCGCVLCGRLLGDPLVRKARHASAVIGIQVFFGLNIRRSLVLSFVRVMEFV